MTTKRQVFQAQRPKVDGAAHDLVRKHGLMATPSILAAIQEALQTNKRHDDTAQVQEEDCQMLAFLVEQVLGVRVGLVRDKSLDFVSLDENKTVPLNGTTTIFAVHQHSCGAFTKVALCLVTFKNGRLSCADVYPTVQINV